IREHSSSRIPFVIFTLWLNPSASRRFITDPAHPAFGFMAPITTSSILDCTRAPEHIWHGSRVTYMVHPSSRQSPSFLLALRMVFCCAWDRVFLSVFLLF